MEKINKMLNFNKWDLELFKILVEQGWLKHIDFEKVHKNKDCANGKKEWFVLNKFIYLRKNVFYPVDIKEIQNILDFYGVKYE
jgi:hypothetical protein